jgi:hypothetical protein
MDNYIYLSIHQINSNFIIASDSILDFDSHLQFIFKMTQKCFWKMLSIFTDLFPN